MRHKNKPSHFTANDRRTHTPQLFDRQRSNFVVICESHWRLKPGLIITPACPCKHAALKRRCSIFMWGCFVWKHRTCVSAYACDNSVAGGIQCLSPPLREIKASSAGQDVESEVIHTWIRGCLPACQRGLSTRLSLQQPEHTVHFQRIWGGNSSFLLLEVVCRRFVCEWLSMRIFFMINVLFVSIL